MKTIIVLLFVTFSIHGFSQSRLFVDPDFPSIGYDHEVLAIVPFKTTVSLRPKQLQALKEGDLEKLQTSESRNLQLSLYSWFLKRREQGKSWIEIQDVTKTNALLAKNGIDHSNIELSTPEELAKILGVDGVIRGTFDTNKPMSEGASLALGVLFGFYGSTNQATINMFIHNAGDGKVLVNYNKMLSGSFGSTTDQLVNVLLRKASRRIPYTKPKD